MSNSEGAKRRRDGGKSPARSSRPKNVRGEGDVSPAGDKVKHKKTKEAGPELGVVLSHDAGGAAAGVALPENASSARMLDAERVVPVRFDGPKPDVNEMPGDADALHAWIGRVLGVYLPRQALNHGSSAPFDYICHTCFEPREASTDVSLAVMHENRRTPGAVFGTRDVVVWANRGGGKTYMGAIATVLDLVFKPGIEIRVLAGSREQARRMFSHLRRFFSPRTSPALAEMVENKITVEGLSLCNGSRVEVLSQSHTSVRGTRVQKLRCDEVELFKPDVWEAAQFVTRSKECGGMMVHGAVECLSTMHLPLGLMHTLIGECYGGKRKLLRWGVMDVLAWCPPTLSCGNTAAGVPASALPGEAAAASENISQTGENAYDEAARGVCPLWDECGGRAKALDPPGGHVFISDAIAQKRRVSLSAWKTEMLCEKPSRKGAVVPEFDVTLHVAKFRLANGRIVRESRGMEANEPDARSAPLRRTVVGMDFGIRSPTVILFGLEDERGCLWIADEIIESDLAVDDHANVIVAGNGARNASRGLPAWDVPDFVSVDPAGLARTAVSTKTPVAILRDRGLTVRAIRRRVELGVRMISSRLAPATGPGRLFVHERCRELIDSLTRYRYASDNLHNLQPEKDGSDHAVDALRYLIVALDGDEPIRSSRYVG
jgi:hypothetical protein